MKRVKINVDYQVPTNEPWVILHFKDGSSMPMTEEESFAYDPDPEFEDGGDIYIIHRETDERLGPIAFVTVPLDLLGPDFI